jgi:hypothetical protein
MSDDDRDIDIESDVSLYSIVKSNLIMWRIPVRVIFVFVYLIWHLHF